MATITSAASGLWSATGTWVGGVVPVNADSVIIAISHDVEFDVDQSGFAAGITLTITGTLHASTTAGAYVLKLQANMTGAGTLRAGTSGTPYPTTCTFTINRNSFQITSTSMTLDLNCTEPTIRYIRLSAQEAAAQTVLSVDTDVTADPAWVSGAILRICDANFGNDNEERTFSSATATTITITSGLTAQKETSTIIALMSRNVKITHTSTTGSALSGGSGGIVHAEIRNAASGVIRDSTDVKGTISGCTNGLSASSGCTVSGIIAGCTNGHNSGSGNVFTSTCVVTGCNTGLNTVAGAVLQGLVSGCTNGLSACAAFLIYGSITYCNNGISGGGGNQLTGATLTNTSDMLNMAQSTVFNTLFSGTTEFSGYNGVNVNIANFVESINHDQVANAYRAWTRGGIVDSDTGTVAPGRTRSYKHACETASFAVFKQEKFVVQPSGGLVVQTYIRKTVTMAYLPRVWILEPDEEPLISGSPTSEAIMTDSIDTWETLVQVYANSGTSPIAITVRTLAKNASGNVFFDPIITVLAPATYDVYNTLLGYVDTIEGRLPAALVGGRMDSNVQAAANDVITAAVIADNAIDAGAIAANAITSAKIATDAIGAAQIAADAIGSSELAASAISEIQSGLSTLAQADIRTAVGLASANLDTQLSTIDDFLDTEIAAIKAKTDNLPSDPADESSIQATLTTIAGYIDTEVASILAAVDTEVAAIKAKTDNLPGDPADASDIATSFTTVNSLLTTIDDFLDTEVAAIKAKTDSLTFTVAGQVDANTLRIEGVDATDQIRDAILTDATRFAGASIAAILAAVDPEVATLITNVATILAAVDTEVAAIKAKTDNLPADPADESNILAAIAAISMPTAIAIADAVLKRGVSNTEATADFASLTELILAAFESSVSSTTWTVRKTGGTTFNTRTLTLDATALPIAGVT